MNIIPVLHNLLTKEANRVKEWIKFHSKKVQLPIYSSHDIRNSGFKVAPVDANLFPGGFNNLCRNSKKMSSKYFKDYISRYFSGTRKVLILAEEHTRNKFYLENLHSLSLILEKAGFESRIGVLKGDFDDKKNLETADKNEITVYRINIKGKTLSAGEFIPNLIIDNNDFSEGEPVVLHSIHQPIIPSIELGWFKRKKSNHLQFYNNLIEEFSLKFKIDKWFLSEFYESVDDIDFTKKSDFEKAAEKIDKVLSFVNGKYEEYGIKEKPFVFIKNNSGTYGIAVMSAESSYDFIHMNRETKNKMSFGKNKVPVKSLIIQEGIPTIDKVEGFVAEPLIYFVGAKPVGGFFRMNTERTTKENLNTRGMFFESDNLCPMSSDTFGNAVKSNVSVENIKVYEFIAMVSTLAQGYEIAAV
ncbi:MAG: glutamate--cysteine ligase [Candidatus Schekmanbacteria bacterium RIFCSPHIGHO2_02_FULL_38_11]|uniref:Glutamate--cysteine ligase n=1 Tax=Candidatus Schekmanbacteria bacterium RIFCSPLOWO2_12_FULL_38_15 TaxID=1817883 RepID=A0A1F7SLD7_9BACT|nr:MAG: glutamate--cysteine ligase [Candidatus Schekmanbacteria bacterium GWA2_38_9]OGL47944.1 MAG: glutamate--cysteine ligase [Candidatus Schekmanbacteria bacterium RIFCSPLOWO2_02_FULL_38_14]OGL49039.1 MAG: glutamate--cysteine ligase [Candidatus Schekmanbacteria bacterium RIFCSPHIGHO2_02_FULL_38_11]OGL54571.1 MAG: glutamate--cysteine ligase [Candidatus Schekmanbacteria bacterium RIFCSPLOWO2_12_FULL_38_15]